MENAKICIKCLVERPREEFYQHPRMRDGRLNKCKACQRADVATARRAKPDYYRAYDAKRAMRPDRVAMRRDYQRRRPDVVSANKRAWQARNPLKRQAHIIVGNALRDGKIARPERCDCCQQAVKLQAHHTHYSHPLWLAWLCSRCHRLVHTGVITLGRFHQLRRPA